MPAAEKIRVLIVDDIAETRESIRRMLQFDSNIEVIGAAKSGREAIELSQQVKPDVVLMDINMPDMDGITATENIRRKVPFVEVVILSVQNDSNYMRRAMLAGARDFLSKPPMIDDLTSAIRRAGAMAQDERSKAASNFTSVATPTGTVMVPNMPHRQGKIIVVYSPKGGTGRTTVATNLALSINSPEHRAVLIDGSLQFGDIAVFMNEQGKNTVLDLTPRVDELDKEFVEEVMVQHPASGLHLLPCPPKPEYADDITGEQFNKLLTFLRQVYSYVIVDTTSYLTDTVQSALDVADLIVLITTQEIASIKSCNLFMNLTDASGIPRDRILFVMNRHDKRINISPEKVGESLRQEIKVVIPLDERIVTTSINRGIPFVLDNKAAPVSKAIQSLADEVRAKIEAINSAEADYLNKK